MDDVVTIEYRGMQGELAAGDTVVVESCEPGVLRLRRRQSKIVDEGAGSTPEAQRRRTTTRKG